MRWLAAAFLLSATTASAQGDKPGGAAQGAARDDKTFYAIGRSIGGSLRTFSPSPAELDRILAGIRDGLAAKGKVDLTEMQPRIDDLARRREKQRSVAYLARVSKEKGAVKTANGAVVFVEKEGDGPRPASSDKVKVNYTGKLVDGREFDSSVQRGQPSEFPLASVIPCWTEGLQKLRVGGKGRIVCPPAIAYGEQGRPPAIPGDAVLTFDVELLGIVKQ